MSWSKPSFLFNTEDNKALKKKDEHLKGLIKQLETTVNNQQSALNDNQATISSLQSTVNDLGPAKVGTNYVRWGRTVCPLTGSTILYNGIFIL